MIRKFVAFLAGQLFILSAMSAIFLMVINDSVFNAEVRNAPFIEEAHGFVVGTMADVIHSIDPHINMVMDESEVLAVVEGEIDRDLVADFVGDSLDSFNLDGRGVIDFRPFFGRIDDVVGSLGEEYFEKLPKCKKEIDYGTNLPSCVSAELKEEDVVRKMTNKIDGVFERAFEKEIVIERTSFEGAKYLFKDQRDLAIVVMTGMSVLFLAIVFLSGFPILARMFYGAGLTLFLTGATLFVAYYGGTLIADYRADVVEGVGMSSDRLFLMIQGIINYLLAEVVWYAVMLVLVGALFGGLSLFIKRKNAVTQ